MTTVEGCERPTEPGVPPVFPCGWSSVRLVTHREWHDSGHGRRVIDPEHHANASKVIGKVFGQALLLGMCVALGVAMLALIVFVFRMLWLALALWW